MSSIIFNNNSSSPAVAGAGKAQIYAKSDGKVYKQVASDTEIEITDLTTVSTAPELSGNKASAKAWVHFNGTTNTGGNCTVLKSFNVSTVTDNGTGDYTINFATNFSDANYCVIGGAHRNGGNSDSHLRTFATNDATAMAVGSCRINSQYGDGNTADSNRVQVVFLSD